jgi:hypothetical protein
LNVHPAVLWPPHGFTAHLPVLLHAVEAMAGTLDLDALTYEPTEDEIDGWLLSMMEDDE